MLIDGFKLMIIGIGTVFIFLGLMVLIISLSAKILAPFAGLLEKKAENIGIKSIPPAENTDKLHVAAAIAAVQMHRKNNQKN
jgi:sodium pump decarboxylase gamma subunit